MTCTHCPTAKTDKKCILLVGWDIRVLHVGCQKEEQIRIYFNIIKLLMQETLMSYFAPCIVFDPHT